MMTTLTEIARTEMSRLVEGLNEPELRRFFERNLSDLVDEKELRNYLTGVMADVVLHDKTSIFFDERPTPVMLDDMWKQERAQAFDSFKTTGDVIMWLCGYFPEAMAKSRRARLGLREYIKTGKTAYDCAIYLGNVTKRPDVPTISRVSDHLAQLSGAIFDFRNRMNYAYLANLNQETEEEIRQVFYKGGEISLYHERARLKIISFPRRKGTN